MKAGWERPSGCTYDAKSPSRFNGPYDLAAFGLVTAGIHFPWPLVHLYLGRLWFIHSWQFWSRRTNIKSSSGRNLRYVQPVKVDEVLAEPSIGDCICHVRIEFVPILLDVDVRRYLKRRCSMCNFNTRITIIVDRRIWGAFQKIISTEKKDSHPGGEMGILTLPLWSDQLASQSLQDTYRRRSWPYLLFVMF